MTLNEIFAEECSAPLDEVRRFRLLGRDRANILEHANNGDPHKESADADNKGLNNRLWENDAHLLGNQMTDLVQGWGFDHLDFGAGLYPTLQKFVYDTDGSVYFSFD